MRIKWHFGNKPTSDFGNITASAPKSARKLSKGHSSLEAFLSQIESDLFKATEIPLGYSNPLKKEWDSVRSLADERNIVIQKADKGSCVVF